MALSPDVEKVSIYENIAQLFYVDFRKLNSKTIKDADIPRVEDTLYLPAQAKYLTKLDL